MIDGLSWLALVTILLVILALVYGVIAIHDIPYKIAKSRNHPHQSAIHAGGWVSLFTLHAIWPFLWIWATAYDPRHGYSGRESKEEPADSTSLEERVAEIESRLAALQVSKLPPVNEEPN
ncbi:DUF3302 domain-containing protein [Stieleria sp. JC731]|uniref:DUF3302 domain-containing protein n=1 Tax=Pirellulaceae TaxID=2691357 RepID=UPI001E5506B7|nr:DUF3302 domain-containing protein [Stieleria sp. JC731]MCC9599089.1 DUF3302 domain-containing protein [Stieleria sp. JC731]